MATRLTDSLPVLLSCFLGVPGAPVSGKDLFVLHAPGSPCLIVEGKHALLPDGTTQTAPSLLSDGSLLFKSNRTGDDEIYLLDRRKRVSRLTHSPSAEDWPVASFDERRIFFVSDRSGHREIWRMDRDGGHETQLTRFGAFTTHPLPLPNGDLIVSSNKDHRGKGDPKVADGRFDLILLDSEGFVKRKLTDGPGDCSSPTLLPGGRIAFSSNETGHLEIFFLEGGHRRRVTDSSRFDGVRNIYAPVYTPNGRLLVSVHEVCSKNSRLVTREFRYVALLEPRGKIVPLTDSTRCDASTRGF